MPAGEYKGLSTFKKLKTILRFLGDHEFAAPGERSESGSKLTNADFRKLMMTPRATAGQSAVAALGAGNNTPASTSTTKKRVSSGDTPSATPSSGTGTSEKAEKRKKKKNYYAKLKRQEDDKMAELAAKYRDRAKERRDGGFPGDREMEVMEEVSERDIKSERGRPSAPAPHTTGGAYRAVAPDIKTSHDAAERRRQMIQESKFLGGDMEHTHLVKGLDFALLQKVRSEIANREKAAEEEERAIPDQKEEVKPKPKEEENEEDQVMCRTAMAKNIIKTVFKADVPDRNELFFPGRMAYIMDLEDEFGHNEDQEANPMSDIPTTTIRSKADVQGNLAHQQAVSMSANDIVINKLTQILTYLRAAGSRGKKKKKDKLVPQLPHPKVEPVEASEPKVRDKAADLPIFDDADDYVPDYEKRSSRDDRDRRRDRDGRRDRDRDRDKDRHHHRSHRDDRDSRRDRDRDRDRRDRDRDRKHGSYFDKKDHYEEEKRGFSSQDKDM